MNVVHKIKNIMDNITTITIISMLTSLIGYALGLVSKSIFGGFDISAMRTARRTRIEARKEAEHKRKIEAAKSGQKSMEVIFAGMLAMMDKQNEIRQANRKPFPPGGITAPSADGPKPGGFGWNPTAAGAENPEYLDRSWMKFAEVNPKSPEEVEGNIGELKKMMQEVDRKMGVPVVGDLCKGGVDEVLEVTAVYTARQQFDAKILPPGFGRWSNVPFSDFKRIPNETT